MRPSEGTVILIKEVAKAGGTRLLSSIKEREFQKQGVRITVKMSIRHRRGSTIGGCSTFEQ